METPNIKPLSLLPFFLFPYMFILEILFTWIVDSFFFSWFFWTMLCYMILLLHEIIQLFIALFTHMIFMVCYNVIFQRSFFFTCFSHLLHLMTLSCTSLFFLLFFSFLFDLNNILNKS